MTLHSPAQSAGGKAVLFTGPFGDPERVIDLQRAMTIGEVVAAYGLAFRLPTIAVMDGAPVLRREWNVRMVREVDVLAFVAMPGQGGSGPGKQIIGLIASIALAVAAPMVGTWVAGSVLGLSGTAATIGASLVSGLVLAGGSVLLNALFPPPSVTPQSQESVYIANAASNQARPFEVVPVLYGEEMYPPPFASRPYSEFQGNDQYLYQLLAVTKGKADIGRVLIGETEAWNASDGFSPSFSDIELQIVQPDEQVTLFPANVVTAPEVAGLPVPNPPELLGPFVVNGAGTRIDRIAVDFAFPAGLFEMTDEGKIERHSVGLRAQYREIDDAGAAIGGWSDVFNETIRRATRTPQRLSRVADVPEGRYEVRFRATGSLSNSSRVANAIQWVGLRGYLTGFKTPENCTLLAIKIRANEQLSQVSASQIKVEASRYLDIWDDQEGAWVEQKTASIAWAAADILRNGDYSIGLPDTAYDLSWLAAKAGFWTERGDEFNGVFDRSWTVADALRAVLRAGRSQPIRLGSKIGFSRLEAKQIKRAVFTARNVIRGSFEHQLALFDEDKPDSVTGEYRDRTVRATREVRAGLAAIGSDAPQKVQYFGITDHDHAWREAVTDAAVNAYQREFIAFSSEWEGKILSRGDPILVHHPFIEGIETAALRALDGNDLALDRDIVGGRWNDGNVWMDFEPWPTGSEQIYAIVRDRFGQEWGPCRVAASAGRKIALDPDDRVLVDAQMGLLADLIPGDRAEEAHVLVCRGETRPFNGLVVTAIPAGANRVDVLAVVDAPEVYLADGTEVMPSPWTPPTLPPAVPLRPPLLGLSAVLRSGNPGMEIDAMWQPAPGANAYVAEVSYDDGDSWVEIYSGDANRFTAPVLPQVVSLRVAAIGTVQGPWVRRDFLEGELPDIRLPPHYVHDLAVENLGKELSGAHGLVTGESVGAIQTQLAALRQLAQDLAAAALDLDNSQHQSVKVMSAQTAAAAAAVIETRKVVVEQARAFAEQVNEIIATIDQNIAGGMLVMQAEVNEDESIADILFKVRAIKDGLLSQAAMLLRASVGLDGSTQALIALLADAIHLMNAEGDLIGSPFSIVQVGGQPVIRINALMQGEKLYINPFTGVAEFG